MNYKRQIKITLYPELSNGHRVAPAFNVTGDSVEECMELAKDAMASQGVKYARFRIVDIKKD